MEYCCRVGLDANDGDVVLNASIYNRGMWAASSMHDGRQQYAHRPFTISVTVGLYLAYIQHNFNEISSCNIF
jgi:hypothetical protein